MVNVQAVSLSLQGQCYSQGVTLFGIVGGWYFKN